MALRFFVSDEAKSAGIDVRAPRSGDAGFDLPTLEEVVIPPRGMSLIRTGLHFAIPPGLVGLVRDRSSVALRGGAVTAGVIDSGFRGELKVVMHNLGPEELRFRSGERVAQLLLLAHQAEIGCEQVPTVEDLGSSARGTDGFGSTGK